MPKIKNKNTSSEPKNAKDKLNMEAAKELGIDSSNDDSTTEKIIDAYDLSLKNKL
ncbi:MAG: hypothetical protein WCQ54_05015 [Clostridiaceae bacterium]